MKTCLVLRRTKVVLLGTSILLSSCGTQPLPGAITQVAYLQQGIDVRTHSTGVAPQLGLALAGGGTKAADFSIGVLQGLIEAEVMNRVDAVSTVSGGGYAALWYFSRRLNPTEFSGKFLKQLDHRNFAEKVFTDCIPWKYVKKQFVSDSLPENKPSSEYRSSGNCPRTSLANFYREGPDTKTGFEIDQVRYQNHLRGYQDIFALNLPLNRSFRYQETTMDQGRNIIDSVILAALTAGSIALNTFPNMVFDWEIPLSVSRWKYEEGIVRTFGAIPANCTKTTCTEIRPEGNEDWVKTQLTFDLLKKEYEKGTIPLWVINATAGENRDVITTGFNPGQKPFQLTSFELTPYGSGSGLFRYSSNVLSDLSPWKAVTSSAAFLDSQQKIKPPKWNPFLKFSTLDWGRSLSNPYIHWVEAAFHRLLPFPLYLFHGRAGSSAGDYVNIRLSDGGQSENLGAYALIQRKLPDIIVSDHSFDRSGRMEDVCRLKQGLANEHGDAESLYIYFPGLADLDEVCVRDSQFGYDIFNWDHPIVLGCVTSDRDSRDCVRKRPAEQSHFQRIYLIKPSLPSNKHLLGKMLSVPARACKERNSDGVGAESLECKTQVQRVCRALAAGTPYPHATEAARNTHQSWMYEAHVSCELLGFLMIDAFNEGGFNKTDLCPHFPQGGTIGITASSSPFLFGAYRELGRHYARQLGWFFREEEKHPISEQLRHDRFQHEISYQGLHPLIPKIIRAEDTKAGEPGACLM